MSNFRTTQSGSKTAKNVKLPKCFCLIKRPEALNIGL
jgi:hypothetical protein